MKTSFTEDEVWLINVICAGCEDCSQPYHYCKVLHTDSVVFKYDKCIILQEAIDRT